MPNRSNQAMQVLVDQPVCADDLLNLFDGSAVGNQLRRGRHVDAVHVRIAHRRRRRRKIDLAGARLARQLDDLLRGRAAHDRIVDQQHVLAAKLEVDGVQLATHRLRALCLARHDKGAADIAILDKAFAILDAEMIGDLQRRGAARIGNRDNDVDVVIGKIAHDLARQLLAHAQPCLVHGQVIDNRIGSREIHVLEYARRVPGLAVEVTHMQGAVVFDEYTFTRLHITHAFELQDVQRHAFRRDHVVLVSVGLALAEHQRPNAVRIAKRDDAEADNHRDDRVTARAAPVHGLDRVKNVLRRRVAVHAPAVTRARTR